MTREPSTPEEPGSAPDLSHEGMAAGADGLPLPPPDDAEKRLAEDAGKPDDASDKEDDEVDGEQQSRAAEISAERGAD